MKSRTESRIWKSRVAAVTLLCALGLALAGCYNNVRGPGPTNGITTFQLDSDDYQILGTVEAEGTIYSILGLFNYGGQGFSALREKALKMGGDDVINVQTDLEVFGVLFFVYNEFRWKATGTVIRYRSGVRAAE
ncbi:MAG: hypothetical protein CMN76_03705 [Spirochaetaceae bacterium]|nr:hypothetical protein [Spirochaetaceae bacterium]|tara:strand:- start:201379 stop:201780 length:402 start_codon:yes stop_codon:yes gene_type:complete